MTNEATTDDPNWDGHKNSCIGGNKGPCNCGATDERDWTEDFAHENGKYFCECAVCKEMFTGHKRRAVCKLCSKPKTDEQKALIAGLNRIWDKMAPLPEILSYEEQEEYDQLDRDFDAIEAALTRDNPTNVWGMPEKITPEIIEAMQEAFYGLLGLDRQCEDIYRAIKALTRDNSVHNPLFLGIDEANGGDRTAAVLRDGKEITILPDWLAEYMLKNLDKPERPDNSPAFIVGPDGDIKPVLDHTELLKEAAQVLEEADFASGPIATLLTKINAALGEK